MAVHVEYIKKASASGGGLVGDSTVAGPGSHEIALLAAGGGINAVDAVLDETLFNAYVLCRPPGHHAEPDRAMGFCLYNNVAVAAQHALKVRGLSRVAVVDFDVHHGNGTEKVFWESDQVLFISVHQDHLYPATTGNVEDIGGGKGKGFTINCPLPPGCGIGAYRYAFDSLVAPAIGKFDPELVLVSSGVDAGALDPLSHAMLPSSSFGAMAAAILSAAAVTAAEGKAVFFHEGGYSSVFAPFCVHRIVEALCNAASTSKAPAAPPTVVDDCEDEIQGYGGQELQPHQQLAIERAMRLARFN